MLIRAIAYFLGMVGRRNLCLIKKSEIDSSDYCTRQGEIIRSECDDAWNFLISWEQSQRLDQKECQELCPVEIHVPLQNYPITVSQIIISGSIKNIPESFSANYKIPVIPKGCFGKLIVKHNEYHVDVDATVADVWVVDEEASDSDQMTAAEAADVRAANEAAAERAAVKSFDVEEA